MNRTWFTNKAEHQSYYNYNNNYKQEQDVFTDPKISKELNDAKTQLLMQELQVKKLAEEIKVLKKENALLTAQQLNIYKSDCNEITIEDLYIGRKVLININYRDRIEGYIALLEIDSKSKQIGIRVLCNACSDNIIVKDYDFDFDNINEKSFQEVGITFLK